MSKAELVPFPLGLLWLGDLEQVTALSGFLFPLLEHICILELF